MEDTTISIIALFIAMIIMFIVPLVTIADRADDIAQLVVQTSTASFVDDIIKTGEITRNKYDKFIQSLGTSGNTYEIDIELKILDSNSAKKTTDQYSTIGKNAYYSIFSSQIEDRLQNLELDGVINGKIILKEGDVISVTVRNSSTTLSQALRGIYYKVRGEEIHIITATASGTIAINGAT